MVKEQELKMQRISRLSENALEITKCFFRTIGWLMVLIFRTKNLTLGYNVAFLIIFGEHRVFRNYGCMSPGMIFLPLIT